MPEMPDSRQRSSSPSSRNRCPGPAPIDEGGAGHVRRPSWTARRSWEARITARGENRENMVEVSIARLRMSDSEEVSRSLRAFPSAGPRQCPFVKKAVRSPNGRRPRTFRTRCRLRFSRAGLDGEPRIQGFDCCVDFSSFFPVGFGCSVTPNRAAASAAKATQLFILRLVLLHLVDGLVEPRAVPCRFSPVRRYAMARKNQSTGLPPAPSCIDFSSASMAAFQSPTREWAAPNVRQWPRTCCLAQRPSSRAGGPVGTRRGRDRDLWPRTRQARFGLRGFQVSPPSRWPSGKLAGLRSAGRLLHDVARVR